MTFEIKKEQIIKTLSDAQQINFDEAARFLNELGTYHMFQTFDDSKEKKQSLVKVFHGTFEQHKKELERLNKNGAGVFVTVNQTDGQGRKKENIKAVRALFVDHDTIGTLDKRLDNSFCKEFPPSMIIESSPGKHHLYWMLDEEVALDDFTPLQKVLIKKIGSDDKIHDLPRVMRIPGFLHNKNEPFLSRIIDISASRHSLSKLKNLIMPIQSDFKQKTEKAILKTRSEKNPNSNDFYSEKAFNNAIQVLRATGEGSRNDELNKQAVGLFALVKASRLNELEVRSALYDAAISIGLSEHEIKSTLQSAWNAARPNENGTPDPEVDFNDLLEKTNLLTPDAIDEAEEIVKKAKQLNPIKKEKIFKKIKDKTGLTLDALRSFEKEESKKEDDPDHLELARRIIDITGSENIIGTNSFVYLWNDSGLWDIINKLTLKKVIQGILEKSEMKVTRGLVDGVFEILRNEINEPDHQFNIGNPEVINCLNGELHLNEATGLWELKPHHRESYRTTQIPIHFDFKATAPRFVQFLDEIFENDKDKIEKRQALLEMIGYSLTTHCKHEKFILLIGGGSNGKSVILSIMEALCGSKNVAAVQPSQLENKFQRGRLHRKLVNIVTEIKQGAVVDDAALKSIVSGELVTVEHKNQDPFEMRPFSTCWFGTNHMPHTRDFSDALFRRAVILTFNQKFEAGKNADPNLKEKLLSELSGILNLVLTAYSEAVKNGFAKPESSEAAKQEWKLEADQAAQFVEEVCEKDDLGRVQMSFLYNRYKVWADDNGIRQMLSMKSLRDRLSRLNFGKAKDRHGKYVTGISVRI